MYVPEKARVPHMDPKVQRVVRSPGTVVTEGSELPDVRAGSSLGSWQEPRGSLANLGNSFASAAQV